MYILISPSKSQHTTAKDAINFFTGTVFKELKLESYNELQLQYLYRNVIILSEINGFIRADEKVYPHRPSLTKARANFLRNRVTTFLQSLKEPILNLSSLEYSALLDSSVEVYTPDFGKLPSVLIKKARGKLLNFCIENMVDSFSLIKGQF